MSWNDNAAQQIADEVYLSRPINRDDILEIVEPYVATLDAAFCEMERERDKLRAEVSHLRGQFEVLQFWRRIPEVNQ